MLEWLAGWLAGSHASCASSFHCLSFPSPTHSVLEFFCCSFDFSRCSSFTSQPEGAALLHDKFQTRRHSNTPWHFNIESYWTLKEKEPHHQLLNFPLQGTSVLLAILCLFHCRSRRLRRLHLFQLGFSRFVGLLGLRCFFDGLWSLLFGTRAFFTQLVSFFVLQLRTVNSLGLRTLNWLMNLWFLWFQLPRSFRTFGFACFSIQILAFHGDTSWTNGPHWRALQYLRLTSHRTNSNKAVNQSLITSISDFDICTCTGVSKYYMIIMNLVFFLKSMIVDVALWTSHGCMSLIWRGARKHPTPAIATCLRERNDASGVVLFLA